MKRVGVEDRGRGTEDGRGEGFHPVGGNIGVDDEAGFRGGVLLMRGGRLLHQAKNSLLAMTLGGELRQDVYVGRQLEDCSIDFKNELETAEGDL